jgi:hypothetical protein
MFGTTERKCSCDYSTYLIPNSLETTNILKLLWVLQHFDESLLKVEYSYLIVRAQNFSPSPLHLVSTLFFYMRSTNEGIFAYSTARKRDTDRLLSTVKCVVHFSKMKPK